MDIQSHDVCDGAYFGHQHDMATTCMQTQCDIVAVSVVETRCHITRTLDPAFKTSEDACSVLPHF